MYRDREGSTSNQSVVHGVISSFVDVERYKKKARLKVHVNECLESIVNVLGQQVFNCRC